MIVDGCNGIMAAIKDGFIQPVHYYTDDAGAETDWVLGFVLWETDDDENDILTLNYCPFCGTRLAEGKPTCGGLIGIRTETKRDTPGAG